MALRRRIRELEDDRRILFSLVEALAGALRECSDSHVRDLVCLVRNKAPLEEIRPFPGHACSSSDKSDEDTGTDTNVVVGKSLTPTASIYDARNDPDIVSPDGLPPSPKRSNSCVRLSIPYLINDTAPTDDADSPVGTTPDLEPSSRSLR
jgi:hypothetical protein